MDLSETELVELVHSTMADVTPFLVQDASVGLLSDTYLLKKSRLDSIIFIHWFAKGQRGRLLLWQKVRARI